MGGGLIGSEIWGEHKGTGTKNLNSVYPKSLRHADCCDWNESDASGRSKSNDVSFVLFMKATKATERLKSEGGFRVKSEPLVGDSPSLTNEDSVTTDSDQGSEIDELGELPRSYGSNVIFLVAQEPHWLFTYWDIDISRHPGGPTHLRVFTGDTEVESQIEVPFETRNWYIPVKQAGASYHVEIGYLRGGEWKTIARSKTARTPVDRMSESESFQCATIPLHLSFESLMGNLKGAVLEGEALLGALARLQLEGKLFPEGSIGDDRLTVLRALLGQDFMDDLSSGSLSSADVETRIRAALQEKLSSGGSSQFALGGSLESAESSFLGALGALSSGGPVSSWNVATLSSWATLVTWAAQARSSWGGENLSSGGETLSSAGKALSSQGGAFSSGQPASSWAGAATSSWGVEHLSSWLKSAQSSWTEAALSSWNAGAFSSWSQAATSSWGGGSENLSSFGAARKFFMHVNAEVIFYGGTDPQASVTVDGKPIKLAPDGSFRYHFIFPDGEFEIPIVATSPDGLETRKAFLRFERDTSKVGGVDDTSQPPLGEPMGKVSET